MAAKYRPLRRTRDAELQRLADRVGKLVRGGGDAVMLDDIYRRMAHDWSRVPPTAVEDLESMQKAILSRMGTGTEDADDLMRIYQYHADQLRQDYQRALAVRDAEAAPPPPPPSRGQKVAAFGAGAVAGHYGYKMAERMIGDLLKPVGTLLRLFK